MKEWGLSPLFCFGAGEKHAMSKEKKPRTVDFCRALAQPALERLGLALWDLRFEKEGGGWFLRYFIDKDGGVTIQDLEAFSRAMDPLLDAADPIEQSYTLEVSSPGIERKLTRDEHFARYTGSRVAVRLIRARDGMRDFAGELLGRDDSGLRLRLDSGEEILFAAADIAHVKLWADL